MSPECVCEVLSQNILFSLLNWSLFEGKQKRTVFVSVPLNANELLLPAQGAGLTQTCTENFKNV